MLEALQQDAARGEQWGRLSGNVTAPTLLRGCRQEVRGSVGLGLRVEGRRVALVGRRRGGRVSAVCLPTAVLGYRNALLVPEEDFFELRAVENGVGVH